MLSLRKLRTYRSLRLFIALFAIWNVLELLYIQSKAAQPTPVSLVPPGTRVYIASIHWNNEAILRSHWNDAVVELTRVLGPHNVFVSVYESGSWDNSKGALHELDQKLGDLKVPRNITLSETTHKDEISRSPASSGWINTPRGKPELRRIPYLSRLRNYTLYNLLALAAAGKTFDKILFLNDVVFTTNDILTLLSTNSGSYAAACSLDFSKPPSYYDTFALRDIHGHATVMPTWPYFRSRTSRSALKRNEPVPVTSCWNGLVAMPAAPFLPPQNLAFRGITDSLALKHLEGSECCLIHADNPLTRERGVWVNPRVRVGYNGPAYSAVNPVDARGLGSGGSWLSGWQVIRGLWENRIRRWLTTAWVEEWIVKRRVGKWMGEEKGRREDGVHCLINEMQVLVENGWAHV
ncbi:hypothetical protein BT63DRAFT_294185 [Microthyrium microscopicum]|uniref:Polysaccharide export protein n=1 Tax=Microthyrium microscopicum TaxID=703497 RepID=A0A6A6U8A1_9PEZI|nr:hypothetical protein BT63DRAFT_294185 [Microthyrium microscopicum]